MSHIFTVLIDGEPLEVHQHTATPNELLRWADLDPAQHYLQELRGNTQTSYEGKGDEEIHLHEGSKFISVFTGATPVADVGPPKHGAARFVEELRAMGYEVTDLGDGHIVFPYTVDVGPHAGTEVELGFVIPDDFPLNVPHGPHVRPHIHPIGGKGEHPQGGIHPSSKHAKHFSDEFQHWSRPYPDWEKSGRTVRDYMAFIRRLWATQ